MDSKMVFRTMLARLLVSRFCHNSMLKQGQGRADLVPEAPAKSAERLLRIHDLVTQ